MRKEDPCGTSAGIRTTRRAAMSVIVSMLLMTGGCSGGHDTTNGGTGIVVHTAAQIAEVQTSAADYNANTNGLITGQTLMNWINNWTANRPAGITGHLIILQTGGAACTAYTAAGPCQAGYGLPAASNGGIGFAGMEYAAHDNKNIFTYDVGGSQWVMARSDGVIKTISMVLDGPSMDAFLKEYNIDPTQDMIVFAMGQASPVADMLIGRGWYMFRYWGVSHTHLAVLDGGIDNALDAAGGYATFTGGVHTAGTGYFSSLPSTPPNSGSVSVRDIPVDNTALQASLGEMLKVALGTYTPPGGAFIWDARSPAEYNGVQEQTTGQTNCVTASGGPCYVAFEGHIRGAVDLNFIDLLYGNDYYNGPGAASDPYANNSFGNHNSVSAVPGDLNGDGVVNGKDASEGYLDKAWLQKLVTDPRGSVETPPNGVTVAAIGYVPGETIYTHCRTTYRAMITGIAGGLVLGYPVKFYDAAWVEWGELGYAQNMSGAYNMPADSPWRTDVATDSLNYNPPSVVEVPPTISAYSTTGNAIIDADKAYKTGATGSASSSSGGGSAPANPCG